MLSNGAILEKFKDSEYSYRLGSSGSISGSLRVTERSNFVSVSASGAVLAHLRAHKLLDDYLMLLSDSPHKVTRLDASVDVFRDAADVIDKLRDEYRDGKINLTRKAIKTRLMLSTRDDGRLSGTFYAGDRKSNARVTARVYDKQFERLEVAGLEVSPTVRYELTFGRGYGCTLKDAHDPYSLFYSHAGPLLITIPAPKPEWLPNGASYEYASMTRVDRLPAEAMIDLVGRSCDLETMILLADKSGSRGRDYLLRLLTEKLKAHPQVSADNSLEISSGLLK